MQSRAMFQTRLLFPLRGPRHPSSLSTRCLSSEMLKQQSLWFLTYGRRKKKFPFTVRTTGRVIPFHFCLISVRLPFLSVFKPFPFCPKGSPSVPVNGPDSVIKRAQSLIAQESSRQFSDRDRARARATYHGNRAAEWIAAIQ